MPSFALLPPKDLDAVVDYVLTLTHRGELESQLADEAEFNESIDVGASSGTGRDGRDPVEPGSRTGCLSDDADAAIHAPRTSSGEKRLS